MKKSVIIVGAALLCTAACIRPSAKNEKCSGVADNDAAVEQSLVEESETAWVYRETIDEMTDKTSYYASVESENEVNFDFPYNGGSRMKLTLRDSPEFGKDAYIRISPGQFNPSVYGETIKVRFDKNEAFTMKCSMASDFSGDVLFIRDYNRLVEELKSATSMKLSAEFFTEGTRTFTFNVGGLDWNH